MNISQINMSPAEAKVSNETDSGIDTERKRENQIGLNPTGEQEEAGGPEHCLFTTDSGFHDIPGTQGHISSPQTDDHKNAT